MASAFAVLVLLAVLVGVVRRPWGLPEVAFAAPAALVVLATGLEPWPGAIDRWTELFPTVAFLAGVLALAQVADSAGLFDAAGRVLARAGRGGGTRLVATVGAMAVVVTTTLSLDATVVLFTPVAIAALRQQAQAVVDAGLLATVFLANGGSLLLPVANLTNLLVVQQTGLRFGGFVLRMIVPGLVCATVIIGVCARAARRGSVRSAGLDPMPEPDGGRSTAAGGAPRLRLDLTGRRVAAGLVVVLAGFFVASTVGVAPAWVAVVGAVTLGSIVVATGRVGVAKLGRAANPGFLVFVLALAAVVDAAARHGLGDGVADLVPHGDGLAAMFAMAMLATVAANLMNNLPATLLLLPSLAPAPVPLVLAAVIGLNVGPNLTYPGSLATLLWRRVVSVHGVEPSPAAFVRTSLVATPLALVSGVVALWLVTRAL